MNKAVRVTLILAHIQRTGLLGLLALCGTLSWAGENPPPGCPTYLDGVPTTQEQPQRLDEYDLEARELLHAYTLRLGFRSDPYAGIVRIGEAERVFERMARRKVGGKWVPSPMARVNNALTLYSVGKKDFDESLVQELLSGARSYLGTKTGLNESHEIIDDQSERTALKYLGEYLRRFRSRELMPEEGPDKSPSDSAAQDKKPSQAVKPPQKKEEKPEADKRLPKIPKEYKTDSQDTDAGGDPQGEPYRIAETNTKTALFGQTTYVDIYVDPQGAGHFREVKLPAAPARPGSARDTGTVLKHETFGAKQFKLNLPNDQLPLQPADPRVEILADPKGGYLVKVSGNLAQVEIPLVKRGPERLLPQEYNDYTRAIVEDSLWPEIVQSKLLNQIRPEANLRESEIVRAVEKHFSEDYKYSVKGNGLAGVLFKSIEQGSFQCSEAAVNMAAILRSHKIPARLIGGFRAKILGDGSEQKWNLIGPIKEGHVWVEAYYDGGWHTHDPTPQKLDRKKENQGDEPDPYVDEKLDHHLDSPPSDNPPSDSSPSDSPASERKDASSEPKKGDNPADSQPGSSPGKSDRRPQPSGKKSTPTPPKIVKADPDQTPDQAEKSLAEKGLALINESWKKIEKVRDQFEKILDPKSDKTNDKTNDAPSKPAEDLGGLTAEDLIKDLELGSLELDPSQDKNPLINRALTVLLQVILDPTQNGRWTQQHLERINRSVRIARHPKIQPLLADALLAHSREHPPLAEWILENTHSILKKDVNVSFAELLRIQSSVALYSKVLDPRGIIQAPRKLIQRLEDAIEGLRKLSHPEAAELQMAREFYASLPSLLQDEIDALCGTKGHVGLDTPTRKLIQMLKNGELNEFKLIGSLLPYAEFILKGVPMPEYIEILSQDRDHNITVGNDILPMQGFGEMGRAIYGQPGRTFEENYVDRTLYVQGRLERIQIEAGEGKEDSENITILGIDRSGSTSGARGQLIQALTKTFATLALSDRTASGRHRHSIVVIPFTDTLYDPIYITNLSEFKTFIRDFEKLVGGIGGGTNIELFITQAMAHIADAQRRTGDRLAGASIGVFTDGEAPINIENLRKARGAIDLAKTPLQVLVANIGSTGNEALIKFVDESRGNIFDDSLYREFSEQKISELIEASNTITLPTGKDVFFTETAAQDVPMSVVQALEDSSREATRFTQEVLSAEGMVKPPGAHHKDLERLAWKNDMDKVDPRPLRDWVREMRRFADKSAPFRDPKVDHRVVDDLIKHFEQLTRIRFEDLHDEEREGVRAILTDSLKRHRTKK